MHSRIVRIVPSQVTERNIQLFQKSARHHNHTEQSQAFVPGTIFRPWNRDCVAATSRSGGYCVAYFMVPSDGPLMTVLVASGSWAAVVVLLRCVGANPADQGQDRVASILSQRGRPARDSMPPSGEKYALRVRKVVTGTCSVPARPRNEFHEGHTSQ